MVCLAASLLWLGLAAPAALAQAGRLGGLVVQVRQAETQRPVNAVSITLESRSGAVFAGRTGVDGEARLDDLPEGLYSLRVEASGRITVEEPSVRIVANRTMPMEVSLLPLEVAGPVLEEVLVLGRAMVADPFGAVSTTTLNREELRVAPGTGSDVLRALDGLPGLASTGEFANFSVRGRGPRDNLILVDDMPFDQVLHFDQSLGELQDLDGGGRYSIFAPETIESAEFSPGGWSAAYGGRSGSLLRLDVAAGAPSPRSTLRLDIAGVEFLHEGPVGKDTSVLLSARQFDFGRVFELVGNDDIGTPELTDVILKTSTRLNPENTVEVLAIHASEDYRRDVGNVLESDNFEDVSLVDSSQDVNFLGLSWLHLFGDSGTWTQRLYYRDSDKGTSEGEAFPDLVPPGTPASQVPVREDIIAIDEDETEFGWRSDLTWQNDWGAFAGGWQVSNTALDFETTLAGPWDRFVYRSSDPRPPGQNYITLLPSQIDSRVDQDEWSWSLYGEQVFEWDRWDLRAGLRYDEDGFSDEGYLAPRLSLNGALTPVTRVSATAGLFYQSPRFLDRASDPSNLGLANEEIAHISAGFTHRFNQLWQLLGEVYYQQLDDLVTESQRTSGRFDNSGDGTNFGLDLVLSRDFADGIRGNITYSYNDLRIDDNDGEGEYDGDFNRPHFFSIGGSWEITERWLVSARAKWASARPQDESIIFEDVLGPGQPLRFSKELTRRNRQRGEDFFAVNLRVDYRRPLGPVNLVAFLDVINVLGGEGSGPPAFNPRNGRDEDDDGSPLPLVGFILERNW